jgi:curli production assembly/transport component CsgF
MSTRNGCSVGTALRVRRALTGTAVALVFMAAPQAGAQELVHTFRNPSFGGNPFYSDHLNTTAGYSRPKQREEVTPPLTEDDLLAQQIRSRLTSSLTSDIIQRIEAAKPGESGEFVFGNQRITFQRGTTETRVTFANTTTGETREIVIPVRPAGSNPSFSLGSAEQNLLSPSAGTGTSPRTSAEVLLGRPPL